MDRRRLATLAVVAAALLSGCATTPYTICQSCEMGVDRQFEESVVENSSLAVELSADGPSQWTVRSELSAAAAESMADNRSRVQQVGRAAVTERISRVGTDARSDIVPLHGFSVSNVSSTLYGTTLVTTFEGPRLWSERPGGVLLVDAFVERTDRGDTWQTGTGEAVFVAPEGHRFGTVPDSATRLNASAVRWSRAAAIEYGAYPTTYPEDSLIAPVSAVLVVAVATLFWSLLPAVVGSLFGTTLFGAALFVVGERRLRDGVPVAPPSRPTVGAAAGGVLGSAVGLHLLPGPSWLVVGTAGGVLGVGAYAHLLVRRPRAGVALGAVLGTLPVALSHRAVVGNVDTGLVFVGLALWSIGVLLGGGVVAVVAALVLSGD
jgi:hypothetical protein